MKNKMNLITFLLIILFATSLTIFIVTKNDVIKTITISISITLYHFMIRLIVGNIINLIMKNKANYNNFWFREKSYEKRLYKFLQVKKWKKYIPTYDPDTFNTNKKTIKEILGASCQAEIVHEVIMLFSLLPLILIPFLGGTIAIIVTSVLSMLIDYLFVILQRYNRPKLIVVMKRFEKLK